MKPLFLYTLLFLIQLHVSAQCLLREVPINQRTGQAKLILEGRVTATHSFWNADHSMIYTSNMVEVLKIFKGSVSSGLIDILTVGGIVDDKMIKASPSLNLNKNEVGVFFCEPVLRFKALTATTTGIPQFEVYSSVQGFIKYDLQTQTASDAFRNYTDVENGLYPLISPAGNFIEIKPFSIHTNTVIPSTEAITNFSPSTVTAGTGSILTITGSAFGATQGSGTVGFRNGDDGGATYINPLPSQYLSWSNTQITVEVPSSAATGTIRVTQGSVFTSAATLTVSYSHLNVDFDPGSGTIAYQTDHINDNGSGGYTWRMNTNFAANAAANASFIRAFNTWRCGSDVNWAMGTTTAINDAVSDGTNIVCFDNTAPLSSGILGVCYSYWSGCASGPTIIWYVNELDIIFDEGSNISPLTWEFGPSTPTISEFDFETVAVHELGHGHQLGHVVSPGAIMHYAISNGSANRSLDVNDLAGGNFVQAKSEIANVCGPGAMSAYVGCSTLPLDITSIKAYQKNNGIQVEWTNQSESNVHHYEVEKSVDGYHFSKVAFVSPQANNHSSISYEWFDQQIPGKNNFYRIKAIGVDAALKYSKIVLVNLTAGKDIFSVYPNPVKGKNLIININNLEKGIYTIVLYNSAGQCVLNKTIQHSGGSASESLNLPALATGLYQMKVHGNNQQFNHKMLIE